MTGDDLMPSEAQLWRARREEGLSQHEEAQFKRWLSEDIANREAFLEAEIAWGRLATVEYDRSAIGGADGYQPIEDTPAISWFDQAKSIFQFAGPRALAASLAVILVAGGLLLTGPTPPWGQADESKAFAFVASNSATKVVTLLDGSRITLEPGAEIKGVYSEDARQLSLIAGSASFRVEEDAARPFLVATGAATVVVTGTWFDTELRDGGLEVRVREGSVDVRPPSASADLDTDGTTISLVAGDAIWTGDGVQIARLDIEAVAEARSAPVSPTAKPKSPQHPGHEQLTYRQAPLSQVIADINRFSATPVRLDPSAADLTLSGRFKSSEVESIIMTIDEALPVSIADEGGVLVISLDAPE